MSSTTRRVVTRPLADADLDAVVALSLAAWAPVFATLEEQLGPTPARPTPVPAGHRRSRLRA